MKTNHSSLYLVPLSSLLIAISTQAQITGINPGVSTATTKFLDNNSLNAGNPGSIYTQNSGPWNGSTMLLTQVDPTTFDSANGDITATGSGTSYNISMNNIVLAQSPLNTGFADLNYQFTVEYNIGAAGLPSLPTSFPSFLLSGTVQPASGSYASLIGTINYFGVDASGAYGLVETVNYNWLYNTPGAFLNLSVTGTPINGSTPALGPNTIFDVVGNLTFEVDPAQLTANPVPEPTSLAFVGMGTVSLLVARRRTKV